MENILEVNDFNFSYNNNKTILKNISILVSSGSINAIVGANNSGKTTLIRALAGNLTFSRSIKINGISLINSNRSKYLNYCDIIYISSNKKLKFDTLKLLLRFQLQSRGYGLRKTNKRILEFVKKFNATELLNKKISKLKNFDKAKALLIAAAIHEPKVLFADDLFEGLNYDECVELSNILIKIKEMGVSIIFTTNRLDACIACDNIYFLSESKLEKFENLESLIKKDNILSRNGIIIPPMLDLSQKLKDYDVLKEIIYTPERMVDTLWK